jgi:hypothetical protein
LPFDVTRVELAVERVASIEGIEDHAIRVVGGRGLAVPVEDVDDHLHRVRGLGRQTPRLRRPVRGFGDGLVP